MRPDAGTVLREVRSQRDELVGFLERLVRAESPSLVPESQRRVLELLGGALTDLGFRVRHLPGERTGGHLFAAPRDRARHSAAQLLLGHSDTVWPIGTLEEMPVEVSREVMKGPGIFDMKGGLAQMVFALRTLQRLGLEPTVTPVVFVNSDEEIGSVESTSWIERLARSVGRAFVMEPALGPSGKLKTARKGVGHFEVVARGKAAHAGLDPQSGASAILELSHQVQRLFALNDPGAGVSVNVGTIDGGLRSNVIAPEARCSVDVRVPDREAARRVEQAIQGLAPVTRGVSLEVRGSIDRPPLEPTPRNRAIWEVARRLAGALDIEIDEGLAGGGSDGNTTSKYTATLDGLGAVGDGAHAHHEHIEIDKALERSALLALLMLEPPIDEDDDRS